MKKIILTTLIAIFTLTLCFSQDVITTRSGESIQAKILEVGQKEIKYKKVDNLEGPVYWILKSVVLMVKYENGTVDVFQIEKKNTDSSAVVSLTENLFMKGQVDATKYYTKYKGAGTGTLITSLVSPLLGLIPAIACSSTQPREINLGYPNTALMKNPDYYLGYTQKAKKIKQGKVWLNWGIALGVNLVAELLLISGQSH
jgi:hypothetical protein